MAIEMSFLRGDLRLQARFHRGKGDAQLPTVLLLQGSPGNPVDVLGLGERFAKHGYNTLTFNYCGTHNSEGLSSFADAQLDIAAAYRFLEECALPGVDSDRVILGGWSYGGGMALTYAAGHPEVPAVFSIAGTDHGEFMREYARDSTFRRMVDGIFADLEHPASPWRLAPGATPRETFEQGSSVDDYDLQRSAPDLATRNLLIIGGWDDLNVKIENHLLPLYRALKSQGSDHATMVTFHDDHSFEKVRDQLADSILEWMETLDKNDS